MNSHIVVEGIRTQRASEKTLSFLALALYQDIPGVISDEFSSYFIFF